MYFGAGQWETAYRVRGGEGKGVGVRWRGGEVRWVGECGVRLTADLVRGREVRWMGECGVRWMGECVMRLTAAIAASSAGCGLHGRGGAAAALLCQRGGA